MSTIKKYIIPVLAVVAFIGVVVQYLPLHKSTEVVGGANGNNYIERYDTAILYNGGYNSQLPIKTSSTITSTGGVIIGSSGSTLSNVVVGTCYLAPYASTIAATTTAAVDCQGTLAWNANGTSALTGVLSGDAVQITLSTTTSFISGNRGLVLNGASASTTAGHIQLQVENLTGTTFTWSTTAGTASGTASFTSSR
jgi:hypothetical protein